MKVRFIGNGKFEYNGRQYQSGSIIDIKDIDNINPNIFEYIPKTKANIELRKVQELLIKIESDLNDLKEYQKQYKTRESALLKDINKMSLIKEIKKIKKEVE